MRSIFDWLEHPGAASFVLQAIFVSLAGIGLLLAFILLRRAYRSRYFRRRGERTVVIRRLWQGILEGRVRPETWCFDRLDRDIVESILLDRLEGAQPGEADRLLNCLRASGLLDLRIHQVRHSRGWRRRRALLSLGRMRAPEGIGALAEALDDSDAEMSVAVVRGLGRTALPEAAQPILERLANATLDVPLAVLQNALARCCRSRPSTLLPYLRSGNDGTRTLLARVLGEVATSELGDDLLLLASDPLAEVRASAARALATAKPDLALTALTSLANDEEWFVRLRAAVALGELRDSRSLPVLLEALCDSNRLVRLRAAAALARFEGRQEEILRRAMQTRDRYAVQTLLSELERSGGLLELVDALADPARRGAAHLALLGALRAGTHRLLLDALVHHPNRRARFAIARLLAESGETQLVSPLELLASSAQSARERRVLRWILCQLRGRDSSVWRPLRVPA